INDERNKLEIKHNGNTQIIEKLTREKQENLKSILLLSKTNLLILEKIELLSEGIKQLAEDTQNQRQAIEQIVKDLDVYQEVYEYQIRATKIRQEIAKIAETAMNVENSLKDCFNPFQSLIDEVVKIDADFYATVGEIQHLATNDLNYQPNVFTIQDNHTVSHNLLNLLVASYEKQDRLNEAFFKSQLLDWQLQDSDFSQDDITANQAICLISNYMSTQLVAQKKVLGIVETDVVYSHAKIASEATVATEPDNHDIDYLSEFKSNKNID
ncbi:hypothetical protein GNE54_25825, partial [Trichormus variabilis V5]|nr:hypothetical protein [Trichormus variabilis V5]